MSIDTNFTIDNGCIKITDVLCECTSCKIYGLYLKCISKMESHYVATCDRDRCVYHYEGCIVQCIRKKSSASDYCNIHAPKQRYTKKCPTKQNLEDTFKCERLNEQSASEGL